jgi:hypothetical protein
MRIRSDFSVKVKVINIYISIKYLGWHKRFILFIIFVNIPLFSVPDPDSDRVQNTDNQGGRGEGLEFSKNNKIADLSE